jgi:predicted MFS family arabinose efflux permease
VFPVATRGPPYLGANAVSIAIEYKSTRHCRARPGTNSAGSISRQEFQFALETAGYVCGGVVGVVGVGSSSPAAVAALAAALALLALLVEREDLGVAALLFVERDRPSPGLLTTNR